MGRFESCPCGNKNNELQIFANADLEDGADMLIKGSCY